ncbi:MAG: hypothetical protein Hyperionvirus4_120 [Hyperionvirus sp.]|uniref:Uncharacterized protein n=1 Tax=Hyperionvirus sp. TaxID=2487770 RepID=A0A3G5A7E7_9VIRU|nr:MAG: hypothetical protein Hyperionvirus4_120 [Hyperionvirus sp.]
MATTAVIEKLSFEEKAEYEFLVQLARAMQAAKDCLDAIPGEVFCTFEYPRVITFAHEGKKYEYDIRRFLFEGAGWIKRPGVLQMPIFHFMETVHEHSGLYVFDRNAPVGDLSAYPLLVLSRIQPPADRLGPIGSISRCSAWNFASDYSAPSLTSTIPPLAPTTARTQLTDTVLISDTARSSLTATRVSSPLTDTIRTPPRASLTDTAFAATVKSLTEPQTTSGKPTAFSFGEGSSGNPMLLITL